MILYLLYRIGFFISMRLPLKVSYAVACFIADIFYYFFCRNRAAVFSNIKTVVGESVSKKELDKICREIYRNFAKYLVDFFRFSKIDDEYRKKHVKVIGLENVDEAMSKGKGAIALSAHIGNWELGGSILALEGYPISAVVLSHSNKKINAFFQSQRMKGKMIPIELGITLKSCYRILKTNKVLALLGDRDFTKNGLVTEFFGKVALIPRGPAVLSYRLGSAIIPCYMARESDDTFRLVFEKPIYPDQTLEESASVLSLTRKCVLAMESFIRKYPDQWFVFKNIWDLKNETLHPDTII